MEAEKGYILIIDDTPENLDILVFALTEFGYRTQARSNMDLVWATIYQDLPDLILLDIKMPKIDGYTLCQQIKSDEALHDIPVVFMSSLADTVDKLKGFAVG